MEKESFTTPVVVVYLRRDLRLEDNKALEKAIQTRLPILPVFIFDEHILSSLPRNDARVGFIHQTLSKMQDTLLSLGSSLWVNYGKPLDVWQELIQTFHIKAVFTAEDYEPYAIQRDAQLRTLFERHQIEFHLLKDQVIFHKNEVTKDDGTPYTIFTPYKKKWLSRWQSEAWHPLEYRLKDVHFFSSQFALPSLEQIGFLKSLYQVLPFDLDKAKDYDEERNFPSSAHASLLGPHLRFGTVSVRKVLKQTMSVDETFVAQLIWREFFMQILFHFPHVVQHCFHRKYDKLEWANDEAMFDRWKQGTTGFPLVDAGMRQLNQSGYMHNRLRMVVASFLTKDLLIDWRWGERYFAEKLLDFELSSNNGSWQWAAGTGCDAAPYFRIFNPHEQAKKFDPQSTYIRTWVKDLDAMSYPAPIVNHKEACAKTIVAYKKCNE